MANARHFTLFMAIDESVTDGIYAQMRNSMTYKPHTVAMSSSDFTYFMDVLFLSHNSYCEQRQKKSESNRKQKKKKN